MSQQEICEMWKNKVDKLDGTEPSAVLITLLRDMQKDLHSINCICNYAEWNCRDALEGLSDYDDGWQHPGIKCDCECRTTITVRE